MIERVVEIDCWCLECLFLPTQPKICFCFAGCCCRKASKVKCSVVCLPVPRTVQVSCKRGLSSEWELLSTWQFDFVCIHAVSGFRFTVENGRGPGTTKQDSLGRSFEGHFCPPKRYQVPGLFVVDTFRKRNTLALPSNYWKSNDL